MTSATAQRPTDMSLLGVPVNHAGAGEVHDFIEQVVTRGEKGIAFNLNIHSFTLAMRHRWMHELLRDAHLKFCDGDGVRWGLRMLGHTPPPKTGTTRWIWELAEFCARKRFRLYLLGGRPGVAEEAARRLCEINPGLQIAGTHHGHFEKHAAQNDAVVAAINAARPDVLMVCLGMPEQERWIGDNWRRVDARVFLKGGGALDYAAGRVAMPPEWMVRLHLEWLARILAEPRRLAGRYAYDIPVFFSRVAFERVGRLPALARKALRS